MKLVVTELVSDPLTQYFQIEEDKLVERVRLHLCKFLSPDGSFTLSIYNITDDLIASKTLTLADMISLGSTDLQADYYHGYVSFIFDRALALQIGSYYLKLSASGYTYDENEFLGWVREWDDPAIDIEIESISNSPLTFELYTYKAV